MDDFEIRLKRIPLAKPPRGMKKRIFDGKPSGLSIGAVLRRRVPLGWAALFAMATGLAGMSLAPWLRPGVPLPAKVVTLQIVKSPSEHNLFDFTDTAGEFLPGDLRVTVKPPEEM